ncbi:MAG: hypothetical protein ACMUIP_18245 [bacterium]
MRTILFFCVICTIIYFCSLSMLHAYVIDFETGFADLDPVGKVITPKNEVEFSVIGGDTVFIAKVGDPTTAFYPSDTPEGGSPGSFFLTDHNTVNLGYLIRFNAKISYLCLDLYDFRDETGPMPEIGDTATLTTFANTNWTDPVGEYLFTIVEGLPEGNVETLSILTPSEPIGSASLIFSTGDKGTGIDNIKFTTIPLPTTFLLFLSGFLGLVGLRKTT